MADTTRETATARTLKLLDPDRYPRVDATNHGYYDVLGDSDPPVHSIVQRLMRSRIYSTGYQIGRPIARKLVSGRQAPGRDQDRTQVAAWLGLGADSVVLDVGCGPGNFTGWFGSQVAPDGLAVGVDASHAMLRRAVVDNCGPCTAYLRGDAEHLPFADGVADAVSCLAALYLINQPAQAISEFARVLKPGGRLVILTSLAPRGIRASALDTISGIRWFGRDEVTGLVSDVGFTQIERHIGGLSQTVVATKE
ncbi:class I SAM-dependent methyltransferase [Mycobacterium hubeiense]|uniref:class I SAM-dependent methyltransferase n=1 Tax=Mycobacterium hubeiense TaxID=1867256 RepID=UPI000C7EDF1D|nr:methyltransferase domain-containing protein [Mycobacterium sp. QGD 101]